MSTALSAPDLVNISTKRWLMSTTCLKPCLHTHIACFKQNFFTQVTHGLKGVDLYSQFPACWKVCLQS